MASKKRKSNQRRQAEMSRRRQRQRQQNRGLILFAALCVCAALVLFLSNPGQDSKSGENPSSGVEETSDTASGNSADDSTSSGSTTSEDPSSGDTASPVGEGSWSSANGGNSETTGNEGEEAPDPASSAGESGGDAAEPEYTASATAVIDVKDYGTITLDLYGEAAPVTVENFIRLAQSGFYDGLTFHRIMEGFMMQGGDPEGTGYGGSEEQIVGEFSSNGYENPVLHTRGTISMARATDYNSASSQFFIVQQDAPSLDGNYAAFGRVTAGMDVVDRICAEAEPIDNNGTIPAREQPVIARITIEP